MAAQLDVVGVFGYSDEDGTEAAGFGGKLDVDEIRDRVEQVTRLVEELTAQRAEDRRGQLVDVLIESRAGDTAEGRTEFRCPEVDGSTTVVNLPADTTVGVILPAEVVANEGVDLVATAL